MNGRGGRVAWHARWVLPIDGAPIEHGAVVVEGERITWVGPGPDATAERHERLGEAVLLPGLVNVHAHLELTAMRGFLEGLDFRDWLGTLTRARADVLRASDLRDAATWGVAEMLRAGITTIADCSASGMTLDALLALGARGRVYHEVFGPDPAQCDDAMRGLREAVARLRTRATPLVDVGVSPHAPYTVSMPLARAVADYAQHEALPVATHVAESAAETAFVREGSGPFADRLRARGIAVAPSALSPVARLADTGLLATRPLCVHAIHVSDGDVRRLADAGAAVAHCPLSNAKLAQGIAPLEAFSAAGVTVGLGTDSVASNNRADLLAEARQATLLQSLRQARPDPLSAPAALALATRDGARALGLRDVGVLRAGAAADLAAFPLEAALAPLYDPAVHLVHGIGGGMAARLTMVAGRVLVRDGVVLALPDALAERMQSMAARLSAWRREVTPG